MGRFIKAGGEAAGAASAMGAGLRSLGKDARDAQRGIDAIAFDKMAAGIRDARNAFLELFAAGQVTEFALSALESARAYEKIATRIDFVAGSQARANEEMLRAADLADRMAVSEQAVFDIRSRMLPLEQAGAISKQNNLALTTGVINDGKVTREMFATALVQAFRAFEGAGERSVNTVDGAMTRTHTAWDRFKRSLMDTDAVVTGLNAVSGALNGMASALDGAERNRARACAGEIAELRKIAN